jgi:hypothetical protein
MIERLVDMLHDPEVTPRLARRAEVGEPNHVVIKILPGKQDIGICRTEEVPCDRAGTKGLEQGL